jgi:hypothetical protein
MKFPVRIKGYAGEHDEAGAMIVDANDDPVCSTPHLKENTPEGWKAYHAHANAIVGALNLVYKIPTPVLMQFMEGE